MDEIGNIFLSWRAGRGNRRHIVGKLQKNSTDGARFSYIPKNLEAAQKDGFQAYVEFPDLKKVYSENVLAIFNQRIIKTERADIQDFFDFWEIDAKHKDDVYYMLAHTQGLNPADNFEFLADYNRVTDLSFTSDLANLSKLDVPSDFLKVGDFLRYKLEKDNPKDPKAVAVYKEDVMVGYIKRIHCNVFSKPGSKLNIQVKALEKNGSLKRAFIRVFT